MKGKLKQIVAMLTRLATRSERLSESPAWYDEAAIEHEHEHEHEHEYEYEYEYD